MILSGEDIHTALAEGRMVIDPPPRKEDIDTTSIDLRIGEPLWIWDPALQKDPALNVPLDQLDYKELSERHLVEVKPDAQGRYQIEPQQVYLASTFEKVEFPKPVLIGDTLYVETEVVAKRESKSRPKWGIVTFEHRAKNQRGELVMRCQRAAMMLRRT